MTHYIVDAKLKYGDLYKYESIGEQASVIYRLLTWKEYTSYIELLESDAIPRSVIEEQIFSSCVLDEAYVANIDILLAGDILTLVNLILFQSGPQTEDDVANKLEEKRSLVYGLNSQISSIIPMAFPGCSPEDISAMSWDKVTEMLALAESVLIKSGVLEGPIQFGSGTKKRKTQVQAVNTTQANKSLHDDSFKPPPGDWNLDRMRSQ
jgi:hypothetical protein